MENKNYASELRQINELMLKYAIRFREVCTDLIDNGYMGVFAKQEALDVITKEYLSDNPDIDPYITCRVFYLIGDLSHHMYTKPKFDMVKLTEVIEKMIDTENKFDKKQ